MIGWWATKSLTISFGTLYPMYESYKAVKSPQKDDGERPLTNPNPSTQHPVPLSSAPPDKAEPPAYSPGAVWCGLHPSEGLHAGSVSEGMRVASAPENKETRVARGTSRLTISVSPDRLRPPHGSQLDSKLYTPQFERHSPPVRAST